MAAGSARGARGREVPIAERADGPYQPRRPEREFAGGGFTEPRGSRVGFRELFVGCHQDGRPKYAGEDGTGFARCTLLEPRGRLDPLRVPRWPFDGPVRAGARGTEPKPAARIAFTE
ncbi:hypothetical protein [Streptomyces sp. NPDC001315]|uniref:ATP dependent DNA ligase n=1 Tax=Streptomyces sp. NPDC001315 TaxID=3364562 RepID=UPI0036C25B90